MILSFLLEIQIRISHMLSSYSPEPVFSLCVYMSSHLFLCMWSLIFDSYPVQSHHPCFELWLNDCLLSIAFPGFGYDAEKVSISFKLFAFLGVKSGTLMLFNFFYTPNVMVKLLMLILFKFCYKSYQIGYTFLVSFIGVTFIIHLLSCR
jgi:hypothetical protein